MTVVTSKGFFASQAIAATHSIGCTAEQSYAQEHAHKCTVATGRCLIPVSSL